MLYCKADTNVPVMPCSVFILVCLYILYYSIVLGYSELIITKSFSFCEYGVVSMVSAVCMCSPTAACHLSDLYVHIFCVKLCKPRALHLYLYLFLTAGFGGNGAPCASFADSSSSSNSSEFACSSSVPPPTEDKPQNSELEQHCALPTHLPTNLSPFHTWNP